MDLQFRLVVNLVDVNPPLIPAKFLEFLNSHLNPTEDYFAALRLIFPETDRERCCYGSKESNLNCILMALGVVSRDTTVAGKLAQVKAELAKKKNPLSGHLSIKYVNHSLDLLALESNRDTHVHVFQDLLKKASREEMLYIISVILKDSKLPPSWFYSENFSPYDFSKDSRIFTSDAATLMSLLRKRKRTISLSSRYSVEQHPPNPTSVRLLLYLDKVNCELNESEVGSIYSVYDHFSRSLDIWFTRKDAISPPHLPWTTLNTTRMKMFHSTNFIDDEQHALIATLLGRGVEPHIFSTPPRIVVHGIYLPHASDSQDAFPHLLSVTTAPCMVSAKALQEPFSSKIVKGCMFVFSKSNHIIGPLDRRLTSFNNFMLPQFLIDSMETESDLTTRVR